VPPVAFALFDYEVRGDMVDIACTVTGTAGALSKIFIMNELGADFFCRAIVGCVITDPPSGWQPLPRETPTPAFRDPAHGLSFSLASFQGPPGAPSRLYWGREKVPDYCWAGFEIELDMRCSTVRAVALRYSVAVR
jgi:hypothetical protein